MHENNVSGNDMMLTDKSITFILLFIPFLFALCFADWGPHGQSVRSPVGLNDDSVALLIDTTPKHLDGVGSSCKDSAGMTIDPPIEKSVADSAASECKSGSVLPAVDTSDNSNGNLKSTVFKASITDCQGYIVSNADAPLAKIKRFRGTVVPDGDTVHFRIPVYDDISLENLEFSGIVFNEQDIIVKNDNFDNPFSFASGLWTIISSAGGLVTLGAFTETAFTVKSERTETISLLVCGYIIAGIGQYFGVEKVVKHFRWKNTFGDK